MMNRKLFGPALIAALAVFGCDGEQSPLFDGTGAMPTGTGGQWGTGAVPTGTGAMSTVTCGAANVPCAPGQRCDTVTGTCVDACVTDDDCSGGSCCVGVCSNTTGDNENCGGCGNACALTQQCSAGSCVELTCNGAPPPMDEDAGAPMVGANGCDPGETCERAATGTATSCRCGAAPSCGDGEECMGGLCTCQGTMCQSGETCCDTGCANFMTDANNCGGCGIVCGDGATCVSGACTCPAGGDPMVTETYCDGQCVDIDTDLGNCGTCGNACVGDEICGDDGNGGVTCRCSNPNALSCEGSCIDPKTDEGNCGGCGIVCDGEADTCSGSACVCPNVGDTECSEVCVDLQNDTDNCGGCGFTCADGDDCMGGKCQCGTAGHAYCEHSSGADYTCALPDSLQACGDDCQECLDASSCNDTGGGNYACECDNGDLTYCDGTCANLLTDADNCGECGFECPDGYSCGGGSCICPNAGQHYCDPESDGEYTCINTQTDPNNCGGCGVECAQNVECCKGACQDDPLATDLNDLQNCGACGEVCSGGGLFDTDSCDFQCDGDAHIGYECGTYGLFGGPKTSCP